MCLRYRYGLCLFKGARIIPKMVRRYHNSFVYHYIEDYTVPTVQTPPQPRHGSCEANWWVSVERTTRGRGGAKVTDQVLRIFF